MTGTDKPAAPGVCVPLPGLLYDMSSPHRHVRLADSRLGMGPSVGTPDHDGPTPTRRQRRRKLAAEPAGQGQIASCNAARWIFAAAVLHGTRTGVAAGTGSRASGVGSRASAHAGDDAGRPQRCGNRPARTGECDARGLGVRII